MKKKRIRASLLKRIRAIPLWIRLVSLVLLMGGATYGLIFGPAKPVAFTYESQVCVPQLTLFPAVMRQTSDSGFMVHFNQVYAVGETPVLSLQACFTAQKAPRAGQTAVGIAPGGGWFAQKRFNVSVAEPRTARTTDFIGKTLPVTRPISIGLSGPDDVYRYDLTVGKETIGCDHGASTLRCDIRPLELPQGATLSVELTRSFDGVQLESLAKGEITTLRALVLEEATLARKQVVYDKPADFRFRYDKTLRTASATLGVRNDDVIEDVDVAVTVKDQTVIVTPSAPLPRNADFLLTLESVEAEDGSALPDPYIVTFSTGGGPKVTAVNIGGSGAPQSGTAVLTFDQPIADAKAAAALVSVTGVSAQVSVDRNRILVTYSGGICTDFTITVRKGLKNAVDITQTDDWSFRSRTLCYTTRVFGYSVQGRALVAYTFGSGSRTVLYTGTIHGNEYSARALMYAWIGELDANARSIPAGTRIVVVPTVNPDGLAAGSRYNARGVDLNRNYDTSDWQSDVQTVSGAPLPGGGGSAPGSEPETKALMALSDELRPALTMSYHSSASYAIGNTCGNSAALADRYAQLTGYSNMTGVSGAFSYQITGTYDDWLCERRGLTSVLIELATSTNAEFSRNRAALWEMARS